VLGLGWAAEIGASILPVKLFITRSVGDTDEGGELGTPRVVLVTQRRAENVSLFFFLAFGWGLTIFNWTCGRVSLIRLYSILMR
jgi:hypothetical protein